MTTRAKRKLLAEVVLSDLSKHLSGGGKLTPFLRERKLPIHRNTVVVLLAGFESGSEQARESLFPSWLDETNLMPQVQPDGFAYKGNFPYGEWVEVGHYDYM